MGIIEKMRLDGKKGFVQEQQEESENAQQLHLQRQEQTWRS